jgi:hypothetical protein
MIKLRNAGAASILTLFLTLTLLTTGAFAQSIQVSKSASAQGTVAVHSHLGGGPVTAAPAAPVMPAAPVVHKVQKVQPAVHKVRATAIALARGSNDCGLFDGFLTGCGAFSTFPFFTGFNSFGCGNSCGILNNGCLW